MGILANASTFVAVVGLALAISVWFRTKRVGPVVGVLVGAFVVLAVADPTLLSGGATKVGEAVGWFFEQLTFA